MSVKINWHLTRKYVMSALLLVFFAGLLSDTYTHLSYWANMPRTPDPATGRVFHIYVNHHTLVYVTERERDRAEFVFTFVGYGTFAVAVLLAFATVYWTDPSRPTVSSSRHPS